MCVKIEDENGIIILICSSDTDISHLRLTHMRVNYS